MRYLYDLDGFFACAIEGDADRSTAIAPMDETETHKANFVGDKWVLVDMSAYLSNKQEKLEEVIEASQAEKEAQEARNYLASTDWYIIRAFDSGVLVPEEIKAAREAARQKI